MLIEFRLDALNSVLYILRLHFFHYFRIIPHDNWSFRFTRRTLRRSFLLCNLVYGLHLLHVSAPVRGHVVICHASLTAVIRVDNGEFLVPETMSGVHKENPFAASLQNVSHKLQFPYPWWPINVDDGHRRGDTRKQVLRNLFTRIELINVQLRVLDPVLYELRRKLVNTSVSPEPRLSLVVYDHRKV